MKPLRFFFFVFLAVSIFYKLDAMAQLSLNPKDIGITGQVGQQIGLKEVFHNESGNDVELSHFFNQGRPVILSLVYYECPSFCTTMLNNLVEGLNGLNWEAGRQFNVLVVSIDPHETASLAKEKKAAILSISRSKNEAGWNFLTGSTDSLNQLAKDIGFGYIFDEATKQYLHAPGIFVLSPQGKIKRILYGSTYSPQDLKMALGEAGVPTNFFEKIKSMLFEYDVLERKYKVNKVYLLSISSVLLLVLIFCRKLSLR